MCAVVVCMTERRRHSAGWIGRPCIVRRLPFPRNTTSPSAVSNHVSGRQQRKMHYIHAYPRGEGGIQEKGGIQERGRGGGEGRRRDGGTPVDGKIKSRNEPHPNDQLDCRGVMGTGLWGRCEHTSYHRYHQSYSPPVLTPGRAALLSLGMGLRACVCVTREISRPVVSRCPSNHRGFTEESGVLAAPITVHPGAGRFLSHPAWDRSLASFSFVFISLFYVFYSILLLFSVVILFSTPAFVFALGICFRSRWRIHSTYRSCSDTEILARALARRLLFLFPPHSPGGGSSAGVEEHWISNVFPLFLFPLSLPLRSLARAPPPCSLPTRFVATLPILPGERSRGGCAALWRRRSAD